MLNKLGGVVASCAVLVAFTGFSANAFAYEVHDPACDEWENEVGLFDFSIDTAGSHKAYAVSNVVGSFYACGSSLQTDFLGETCISGYPTLYNHADITVPRSAKIADSDPVAIDSLAGWATVNVLVDLSLFGCNLWSNVSMIMTVQPKSECESQRTNRIVGPTPQGPIVSCLRNDSAIFYGYSWSTLTNGKLALTIGPMRNDTFSVDLGITFVDFDLCDYYGNPGGQVCGSEGAGDQWQQRNGCDLGTYTATATMYNETVTPMVQDTVQWGPPPTTSPPHPGNSRC